MRNDTIEEIREVYVEIDKLLNTDGRKNYIPTDYIHGYVTALICFPGDTESIDEKVWFDFLFSSPAIENQVQWSSREFKDEVAMHVREASYQVEDYLEINEYIPLIEGDPESPTKEMCRKWINGFIYGLELWEKQGIKITTYSNQLMGFLILSHEESVTQRYDNETLHNLSSFLELTEQPKNLIIASVFFLYESIKNNIKSKFPDLYNVVHNILKLDITSEYVHGYLTSIASSPVKINRSKWIERLLKDNKDANKDSDIYGTLENTLNDVIEDIRNNQFLPFRNINNSDDNNFSSWCKGYVLGLELWSHYYGELKEFLIFKYCADKDSFGLDIKNKLFIDELENKIKEFSPMKVIVDSVNNIFLMSLQTSISVTTVKSTPKVGRNDPCPCGSGKKYKKCCGK